VPAGRATEFLPDGANSFARSIALATAAPESTKLPILCMTKTAERFAGRAESYHAFRPRYSPALLDVLRVECGLHDQSVVADIGAGTGISTELFLSIGNHVWSVEPNAEMRRVAESNLGSNPRFHSVDGTAEQTALPNASVDFVVAGQAFHWFDRKNAAVEFARILRPSGWIVLVWNERLTDTSAFAAAYEHVLKAKSVDYSAVDPKRVSGDAQATAAFLRGSSRFRSWQHRSWLTREQLFGLAASASYTPMPGHPSFAEFSEALGDAFARHAEAGVVPVDYEMKVFYAPKFDP
jgi:SAM-dependent methyltransferase